MCIFKKFFKRKKKAYIKTEIITSYKTINLANIEQFDDVWLKINNNIFEGWVVERKDNFVYISYSDENNKLKDAFFTIERPLERNYIEQNKITLFLTKPK